MPELTNPPEPPAGSERLRGLRRKLARLNRAPLPELARPEAGAPPAPPPLAVPAGSIVYRRDLPSVPARRLPQGGGICIPLGELVAGRELRSRNGAALYLIERPIAEAEPEAAELPGLLARALECLGPQEPADGHPRLDLGLEQLCFLDIETTGLGSTPVFLIGTLLWRGGDLVCRQFLARTYAEEASIVEQFVAQAQQTPALVTFNGKTFDLPYLRVRAAATAVPFCEPKFHLDLLHASRRLFRRRLPDCKLQTLERYVCRRYRGDDISGQDIPRAYHDFVRTGDARELALIIRHNQCDLVTMAHLMARLFQENPQSAIRNP